MADDRNTAVSGECPTPVRHPVMVQRWVDVVFLHWRYDPGVVQRLLPSGLTVDTFDGSAWVALVPFSMEGLGLPGLAPLPVVGAFPEVNVRTYVRHRGERAVWFFSLDIDRVLPVLAARTVYRLPYCFGRVDHVRVTDTVLTRVQRRWPRSSVESAIAVRTGAPLDPTAPLEHFLTARWRLVSATARGGLRAAPVDHPVWPLHRAEVLALDDGLVRAAGLPAPAGEPHAMWSPAVDVRVGRPRRLVLDQPMTPSARSAAS